MTFSTHGVVLRVIDPFWMLKGTVNRIVNLYDLLIFSSAFLGIAGIAMIYISCVLQGIQWSLPAFIIMFLTPFSVYNLNKKTDQDEDVVNRQDRYVFTKRHEKSLFALAWIAYLCAFLTAVPFGIPSVLVVSIPLVSGIVYSMRWLPRPSPYRRLKEVPVMKNLIVASAWSSIIAFLPVYLAHGVPDMKTGLAWAFFFSPVFIGSIIPDIRDQEGDALAGIKTIPVILGARNTGRILASMNILIGIAVVLRCIPIMPPIFTLIIAAGFIYMHYCISLFMGNKKKNLVCDLMVDGQFIFFGIAMAALTSLRLLP
jgi:4-hydroxybenzoate polyprenyltransferase